MPSGFLTLADGRCFAVRWHYYDLTMRAIAEELHGSPEADALRSWLESMMPGPSDIEELGYGAFLRVKDQEVVPKSLDVRELTPKNQRLFHEAALRAGKRANCAEAASWDSLLVESLAHLADLVERAERGESPLSKSDCVKIVPCKGRRVGPGWQDAEYST